MTRTFIALEMNQALQSYLADTIRQVTRVLPGVHWVAPESIHLTLAFLGELDEQQLAAALEATQQSAEQCTEFTYRLTSIGCFGSPRQPRVIWMGVEEPSGALKRLHQTLNKQLELQGFAIEKRPFQPHLTLARVKHALTKEEQTGLQSLINDKEKLFSAARTYPVRQIQVMKSQLERSGARYTSLYTCPLRQS